MLSGNSSPQHGQRRFPAKPPPRWASKFPKCVGAVSRVRAARQATHCCGKVNFGPGPTEMLSDCNREGSMTADASAQSTNERRRVKSGRAGRSQQIEIGAGHPPLKSGLSRELLREHVREKKQAHGIRGRTSWHRGSVRRVLRNLGEQHDAHPPSRLRCARPDLGSRD